MTNDESIQFKNAYVEVLEVLNNMLENDYNKIPKDTIKVFETFKNKDYVFKYNFNKSFKDQGLSKEAKLILANLYRDYWATENKRTEIIKRQKSIREKIEEEKRKKYNPENIFKNKTTIIKTKDIKTMSQEIDMVEYKESFFKRIMNKIKSIFRL